MKNTSTLTTPISHRPRILIAEDDPFLIEIMKRFMEDEMLEVDSASNGQEAIDLLHKKQYRRLLRAMARTENAFLSVIVECVLYPVPYVLR